MTFQTLCVRLMCILFTNVPLDVTVDICLDALYRSDLTFPHIDKMVLKKLLTKATKEVEFSFNNKMYKQVDSIAIGSPLGPTLANIFVGFMKESFPMM